jgi:hypothetical protein
MPTRLRAYGRADASVFLCPRSIFHDDAVPRVLRKELLPEGKDHSWYATCHAFKFKEGF